MWQWFRVGLSCPCRSHGFEGGKCYGEVWVLQDYGEVKISRLELACSEQLVEFQFGSSARVLGEQ